MEKTRLENMAAQTHSTIDNYKDLLLENEALRDRIEALQSGEISDTQRQSIMSFVNEYGLKMFDLGQEADTEKQDALIREATTRKGFIKMILGLIGK